MAIIQQSLKDVLADLGLGKLPQEGDLQGDWQEAIILIARNVGGVQSYAYATKKGDRINVVKDFGFAYQCSGIKAFLKAYPLIRKENEENNDDGLDGNQNEQETNLPERKEFDFTPNEEIDNEDKKDGDENLSSASSDEAMEAAESDNNRHAAPFAINREPNIISATGKKRGRPRKTNN